MEINCKSHSGHLFKEILYWLSFWFRKGLGSSIIFLTLVITWTLIIVPKFVSIISIQINPVPISSIPSSSFINATFNRSSIFSQKRKIAALVIVFNVEFISISIHNGCKPYNCIWKQIVDFALWKMNVFINVLHVHINAH